MSAAIEEPAGLDVILRTVELQAAWCRGNGAPFTANILDVIHGGLAGGGVLAPLVVPWNGNPLADAVALRITGALHLMVRTGRADNLAQFYPGHGTAAWDLGAASRAVEAAVAANLDFVHDVLTRPPQTNETGRSAVLMPGYAEIAKQTGMPLSILELGASAGLNLMWDRYAYRYGARFVGRNDAPLTIAAEWRGPWCGVEALPRVVGRRGCDRSPFDLSAPGAADRLIAYVWPEQADRLARLEAAIALAQREKPVLEKADAAEWLEQRLAVPAPGVATVVAHTIVWQYFSKETRARARAALDEAGARATATAPLAWLSLEQYAPDQHPELRLAIWPGGEIRTIARAHPHGAWIEWIGV
jgi:hypothetical protein